MDKLKLHSPNFIQDNIAKLAELFPNCITETLGTDGMPQKAIDFDQLRQELSDKIVEGPQERYQLNWPGKREALLTANAPIAKTLRPYREESVDFDTTQNLYIEGDNLDALKLLQETYLGKVKMIYIDPPYNTGNDFIYEDDFAEDSESYLLKSNQKDEAGNRLVTNDESNGRFHSDWLSMMYSRLKLARNLLRDDGVIFISIDDNEQANLKRLCDEIFGESNLLATITIKVRYEGKTLVEDMNFQKLIENVYFYAKSKPLVKLKKPESEYDFSKFEWYIKETGEPNIIELGGKKVEVFFDGSFEIVRGEPSNRHSAPLNKNLAFN
ncbi:site-specific DNA-methyltransferase [Crenothrix polyspora]|uniref:site-specific DNA-methyltransferase (adenine-specific) n=1 Tax=Crenothrix polyspora TaxID=360316 RepID=A0A1R4H0F1_9GAMM|nr:site-specific DNA-methyltransferase [Crenothrix polyspora]SJM89718.1 putative Site-specific DNA-methyltransferase (adenine-specific) [Crenothrix polyspora]